MILFPMKKENRNLTIADRINSGEFFQIKTAEKAST